MAGSTSSGKLPAEAAASAGWPAASRPLSPLQSVFCMKNDTKREQKETDLRTIRFFLIALSNVYLMF